MRQPSASIVLVLIFTLTFEQFVITTEIRSGHKKPFGTGKSAQVVKFQGFPDVLQFFKNFVSSSIPLLMKGGIAQSVAVRQWTDDYLLSLDIPKDLDVSVETKKKEDRKQEVISMDFREFLLSYNDSERYMVQTVPEFLRYTIFYMLECFICSL